MRTLPCIVLIAFLANLEIIAQTEHEPAPNSLAAATSPIKWQDARF